MLVLRFGESLHGTETTIFDSEEALKVRLIAPISVLKNQRGEAPDWLEGRLVWTSVDSGEVTLDVKVKARGRFRRKRSICEFPPYWLNFKKVQTGEPVFAGIDRIKVVSHCGKRVKGFEPYVYREYMVYKTFNILTDKSFRVRLARIEYVDTNGKFNPFFAMAFLIEPVSVLEKRLGVAQIEERYVLPSRYDRTDLCRAEFFQYLVATTDFNLFEGLETCCHNAKAFTFVDGSRGAFPVPYDFDLSGLVDVPYAGVDPNFGIQSVRERL